MVICRYTVREGDVFLVSCCHVPGHTFGRIHVAQASTARVRRGRPIQLCNAPPRNIAFACDHDQLTIE
jgi:hypothetical protein